MLVLIGVLLVVIGFALGLNPLVALIIPVIAVIFAAVLIKVTVGGQPLLEPKSETLIGLGVAALVAVLVGVLMLRPRSPLVPMQEGHRLLAGFCGTLTTPMAANFNLGPAALLEMKDKYAPIKAPLPTAVPLLACNMALMYLLAFGVLG